MSQIAAPVSQTQLAFSPPGTTPPFVLSYSASSVPILQLALSKADTLPESQIYDLGNTILRTFNWRRSPGRSHLPSCSAASNAQVQVDLDPQALRARRLSASTMWSRPSGEGTESDSARRPRKRSGRSSISSSSTRSPTQIEDLNNMPIRAGNGTVTYIRDVAHVRDGYSPQTSMVRLEGRRAILMSVLKTGKASTIDIINSINQELPQIRASLACSGAEDRTAQRPIGVRARRDLRRGSAEAHHRRRADRPDDPAVLGQLAQHA